MQFNHHNFFYYFILFCLECWQCKIVDRVLRDFNCIKIKNGVGNIYFLVKNGVGNMIESSKLTARPTAPSPKIATVDPFSTSATFHAAPTPARTTKSKSDSQFHFPFPTCIMWNKLFHSIHNILKFGYLFILQISLNEFIWPYMSLN